MSQLEHFPPALAKTAPRAAFLKEALGDRDQVTLPLARDWISIGSVFNFARALVCGLDNEFIARSFSGTAVLSREDSGALHLFFRSATPHFPGFGLIFTDRGKLQKAYDVVVSIGAYEIPFYPLKDFSAPSNWRTEVLGELAINSLSSRGKLGFSPDDFTWQPEKNTEADLPRFLGQLYSARMERLASLHAATEGALGGVGVEPRTLSFALLGQSFEKFVKTAPCFQIAPNDGVTGFDVVLSRGDAQVLKFTVNLVGALESVSVSQTDRREPKLVYDRSSSKLVDAAHFETLCDSAIERIELRRQR